MIYKVNDEILYNSDDCTLKHIATDDTVKLSITSGRLLEKILHSDGIVLTREALLTEVWDIYGLQGSHNNLNQYISILRRAFANWGCGGLIITIPKVGFRINTDISVVRNNSSAIPMAFAPLGEVKSVAVRPTNPLLIAIVTILIIISMAIFIFSFEKENDNDDITQLSIKQPEGCDVVFLKNIGKPRQAFLLKQVRNIMRENEMRCTADTRVYFVNYTSRSTTNLGRTLAAFCQINDSGKATSCDNIYYKEWRIE